MASSGHVGPFNGRRFRLNSGTFAVELTRGEHLAVEIPLGAIVSVMSGPTGYGVRMVHVRWATRTLVMFLEDLMECGEEI